MTAVGRSSTDGGVTASIPMNDREGGIGGIARLAPGSGIIAKSDREGKCATDAGNPRPSQPRTGRPGCRSWNCKLSLSERRAALACGWREMPTFTAAAADTLAGILDDGEAAARRRTLEEMGAAARRATRRAD